MASVRLPARRAGHCELGRHRRVVKQGRQVERASYRKPSRTEYTYRLNYLQPPKLAIRNYFPSTATWCHPSMTPSPALLTSLVALLITSLLFTLRYYRRAIHHLSPALRRLTKPVVLPQSRIVDGKLFPLTLSPVDANAGAAARISLASTFNQEILALVRTHGAVLLRGWSECSSPPPAARNKAHTAAHFSELMATLELPVTAMACSAGPRFAVAANVFTANEAPPAERIPFHHEMVHGTTI